MLRSNPDLSAIEVIQRYRRHWLNDRRGSVNVLGMEDIANPRGIRVYLDGIVQSRGLSKLATIAAVNVEEMRKLDATDATQRFGIGHSAGAILVRTVSPGRP